MKDYNETALFLKHKGFDKADICVVLGTGLSHLAEQGNTLAEISYHDIPGFPVSTVGSHKGMLSLSRIGSQNVLFMQGRFHLYEGYAPQEIAFPVRVFRLLGCSRFIVSNAAGGVGSQLEAGDIMLITDHINFTGFNPLRGPNDDTLGVRFPEMGEAYTKALQDKARVVAQKLQIPLREGVYLGLQGPSMETDAEYRMIKILGAQAVGMSTVTEVIAAVHCGMEVLGFSVIANKFGGKEKNKGAFADVVRTTEKSGGSLARIIEGVIKELDTSVK